MPFANMKVPQGALSSAQKAEIIHRVTNLFVEYMSEAARPHAMVLIEEVAVKLVRPDRLVPRRDARKPILCVRYGRQGKERQCHAGFDHEPSPQPIQFLPGASHLAAFQHFGATVSNRRAGRPFDKSVSNGRS
jgi:phenylpyruvate tautomerase PptA (4-oxalocrotonate tautomerase family)